MVGISGVAHAQAVDTTGVQDMSVDEVLAQVQRWKFVLLGVSMALVLALLFAGGLLKPGGFAEAGIRDLSALPGVVLIFGAFVVLLAQSSAPTVIDKIGWVQDQGYTEDQVRVIKTVTAFVFGAVGGVGMLYILRKAADKAGMNMSFVDFPVGLGCFVLAFPFIQLMGEAGVWAHTQMSGEAPGSVAHPTLRRLVDEPGDPWVIALVGAAVLLAPVAEEIVYRVFVQGALIKWIKSPWLAIVITAMGFALIHRVGDTVPWHALPMLFALGIATGVAYERTKRVGVPIAMHMGFNALNVALAMILGAGAAETGV